MEQAEGENPHSLKQRSSIKHQHNLEEVAGQEEVDTAPNQPGQLQKQRHKIAPVSEDAHTFSLRKHAIPT